MGKIQHVELFRASRGAAALQLVASWLPMKTDAFQRHNASNMLDLRYGEFFFKPDTKRIHTGEVLLGVSLRAKTHKANEIHMLHQNLFDVHKWNIPSNTFT